MKKYTHKTNLMKTTDNSSVYRKELNKSFYCEICGARSGCNRNGDHSDRKNWKRYRNTQYRTE